MPTKKRTKRTAKKSSGPPPVVRGITAVEDLEENHVALFYGKSGRGKTKTAASFPAPILFLDINNEKGLKTVRKVPGVKVAKVQTWQDFEDLYWWLRDGQDFKTIVLDQITGLQDMAISHMREKLKMKEGDPLYKKHWGQISGDMKTWLQHYRELNDAYNVVFIAHERAFTGDEDADEEDIDPTVGARVMPSVGSFVEGACDIIGQNFIRVIEEEAPPIKGKKKLRKRRTTRYCMRIGPHAIYTTKIRRPPEAGPLPNFIVDPTYAKLVAIENGEEQVKTRRKTKRKRRSA